MLRQAVARDSSLAPAHEHLAWALIRSGRREEARRWGRAAETIMFEGHDPYLVALSVVIAILGGYTGYVNFGSAAFFATGAYSSVFLYKALHAPLPVMIVTGTLAAGLEAIAPLSSAAASIASDVTRIAGCAFIVLVNSSSGPSAQSPDSEKPRTSSASAKMARAAPEEARTSTPMPTF